MAATIVVGLVALPALGSPRQAAPSLKPAVEQAPALPGAQSISANDRVYTADQTSNTVSVIDPSTNTMLGTIPFGAVRLDVNADVMGAMYNGEIDVHGLGSSRDGRYLDVIEVTTNAAHVIDTASSKVVHTTPSGWEGPAGDQFLVATRLLTLLADAAQEQPLLVLIDDVHWLDMPSAEVATWSLAPRPSSSTPSQGTWPPVRAS